VNAKPVSSLLELIPERTVRLQSGVHFAADGSACRYPERLAHITRYLSWLTPLAVLSSDDQRILGLLNAAGRPVHAGDLEESDAETDVEAEGDSAAEREDAGPPTESVQHAAAAAA
jgi:hypothetical protein